MGRVGKCGHWKWFPIAMLACMGMYAFDIIEYSLFFSLHLLQPKIDDDSKESLAVECPRIVVNPQPLPLGFRGLQVPKEALANKAMDHFIIDGIDPKTWAVSGATRRPPASAPTACDDTPELSMAERFRLAFLERDARLAPKRAKNARQHRRREEREYLMNSSSAKSIILASQASKFLHNKS
ncbi:hypothetical protein B296_00039391 [Ensete ventricosum]|uniref:Uncharacterized protein n=1 Tax=Ensete ventricosum TaxID=4639 RepID=A0A426ZTE9_ENSVE|nr:hypothetical protein B296_00039391 [Ensete ventricosum]